MLGPLSGSRALPAIQPTALPPIEPVAPRNIPLLRPAPTDRKLAINPMALIHPTAPPMRHIRCMSRYPRRPPTAAHPRSSMSIERPASREK